MVFWSFPTNVVVIDMAQVGDRHCRDTGAGVQRIKNRKKNLLNELVPVCWGCEAMAGDGSATK